MHYIKDLFTDNPTEHLHNKFIRYSRGDFVGPLLKVRFSKANLKVYASFHFVDELLSMVANQIGNKDTRIKGTLLWNKDLNPGLLELGIKYLKVSKARGIFKYTLDNDVNLINFVKTMNQYHVLINIKEEGISYTTKKAFPKPNKEFKADFCKLTLPAEMKDLLFKEFAFDMEKKDKIKLLEISHKMKITDIILPEGEENFDIARRQAKRVGSIERVVKIDGEEFLSQKEFNV